MILNSLYDAAPEAISFFYISKVKMDLVRYSFYLAHFNPFWTIQIVSVHQLLSILNIEIVNFPMNVFELCMISFRKWNKKFTWFERTNVRTEWSFWENIAHVSAHFYYYTSKENGNNAWKCNRCACSDCVCLVTIMTVKSGWSCWMQSWSYYNLYFHLRQTDLKLHIVWITEIEKCLVH